MPKFSAISFMMWHIADLLVAAFVTIIDLIEEVCPMNGHSEFLAPIVLTQVI